MVSAPLAPLASRYDAVLFDVGNTLVEQAAPGVPSGELVARLLRGVPEVFAALRGKVRLGVVSNTTHMSGRELERHLGSVGLADALGAVVATADLGVHKPDPRPLLEAVGRLGASPVRSLYVGDTEVDRLAAAAAGMDFCFTGPDLLEALLRFEASPGGAWERAVRARRTPEPAWAVRVGAALDALAKPRGSLGLLEELVCRIAAIQRTDRPTVDPAAIAVFCADHGVAEDDWVTPFPQSISSAMADVIAGGRAASSVFARTSDAYLEVVDVGLIVPPADPSVVSRRVRAGTANLRRSDAMSAGEVALCLEAGAATAERLVAGGSRLLCAGEVGIGNTTASAILVSRLCGADPHEATGRGAGIDDETLARKRSVVAATAAEVAGIDDPVELAARAGGLEIVALAGFIVAASSIGVPVVLDGVTTQAAACLAREFVPESVESCIAGHRSHEPASVRALDHLGLRPVIDLGLRLGEGTGALLALPLLRACCAALPGMAALDDLR